MLDRSRIIIGPTQSSRLFNQIAMYNMDRVRAHPVRNVTMWAMLESVVIRLAVKHLPQLIKSKGRANRKFMISIGPIEATLYQSRDIELSVNMYPIKRLEALGALG